jgi:hypothetical protein
LDQTKNINLDGLDLDTVRLNIIKNMLKEFPDLKNQITEIIQAKLITPSQESKRISLKEFLRNPSKETMPDWVKLAMASAKKKKDNKYYHFR